jgi:hypothetical protein
VPVVEVTPGADQDGVVDDLPQCVIGGDVQLAIGKANQRGATLDPAAENKRRFRWAVSRP